MTHPALTEQQPVRSINYALLFQLLKVPRVKTDEQQRPWRYLRPLVETHA